MINVVYMIVRIVQFLIFLVSFGLVYKIYRQKGTQKQRLLLLASICAMLNMYGYLEALSTTTVQSSKWAVRSQYVSALMFLVVMLQLLQLFCDYKIHRLQTVLLWAANTVFMILLFIDEGLNILFENYVLEDRFLAVQIQFELRPFGYLYIFYVMLLLFSILYVGTVIRQSRQKELVVSLIAVSAVLPFLAYLLNLAGLTGGYDAGPVLMMASCGYVFRASQNYHLLDDGQIARETILDELSEGYIILDSERNVKSYNTIAAMLYPELEQPGERETIVELIYLHNHDVIEHNGKTCNVVISELKENGDLTGYVVWLYDCTDEYYYMRDLEHLKDRANELDKTRTMFLNHMTVGFDSPLQIINNRADAIYQDERSSPDVREMTLEIFEAGQKMRDMVSVMMEYTGGDAGEPLAEGEYLTGELIAGLQKLLETRRQGRCSEVSLTIGKQLPNRWYGSQAGIEQLLNGALRCAGIAAHIARIELVVTSEVRYEDTLLILALRLDDNGVTTGELNRMAGLMKSGKGNVDAEMDYIPYIFCKQLLLQINGSMECGIEQGGSLLRLMIPQKVVDQRPCQMEETDAVQIVDQEEADAQQESGGQPTRTVMVVDDNLIYLHEMDNWLREMNLKTVMARSGAECLRILNRRKVDLIFMDQMMPEMEGTQVLREIRGIEKEQGAQTPVPVILLTADDSIGARKRYMESGFDNYIPKPIEKAKIREEIRRQFRDV